MRSKTLDKFADTKYNIYIIKQHLNLKGFIFLPGRFASAKLIKSKRKEDSQYGKTEEEAERDRKRTARPETNQISDLRKCSGYRSNHSDNAFGNRHGGSELD